MLAWADMSDSSRPPLPRCNRCEDLIGVYEPMVLVVDGVLHRTSRAAEPALSGDQVGASYYHADCFEAVEGGSQGLA